jgi:hypothetical protein
VFLAFISVKPGVMSTGPLSYGLETIRAAFVQSVITDRLFQKFFKKISLLGLGAIQYFTK